MPRTLKKPTVSPDTEPIILEEFEQKLARSIQQVGGSIIAHAHLDRALTLGWEYFAGFDINPLEAAAKLSLQQKQVLVGELHRGRAYQDLRNMEARMRACLDDARRQGVTEVTSFIDATPDIDLSAMHVAAKLRSEYAKIGLTFRIAAHPIFGFKEDSDHRKSRWEVFQAACGIADIVGALPEKDDRPGSIGFKKHLAITLALAHKLGREYHVHTDQANHPKQEETLRLIEAVRWLKSPIVRKNKPEEPTVWAIHVISPSCYAEDRFQKVVDGLVECNIGVIVCPRAALSMRQDRAESAPIHNSIARVLEMSLAGIRVRIGTDNISDIFIPTGSSLLRELCILADTIRFYDIPVLAKWATGKPLNQTNKETIREHLRKAT